MQKYLLLFKEVSMVCSSERFLGFHCTNTDQWPLIMELLWMFHYQLTSLDTGKKQLFHVQKMDSKNE